MFTMQSRPLPIGIQDFEYIIKNGYLYVDKTAFIYKLVHNGKPYFLSRPRRFGKSLLISTLEAYFLGKKHLFKGLAIESLEKDNLKAWLEYPVIKFSLASGEFTKEEGLRIALAKTLSDFEQKYGLTNTDESLPTRFGSAIKNAAEKMGREVVVLVDEYDTPLLKNIGRSEEASDATRELYKAFFAVLKDYDAYTRFVFFTGVTKFSKVSIFSDLNQLSDITLSNRYGAICGITQEELEANFVVEIKELSEAYNFSNEECIKELKRMYDGYHFCPSCPDIYNPFSLLHAFGEKDFGSYWFESGTPTFLINKLNEVHFDIRNFDDSIKLSETALKDYRPENPDPIPLFYQSGYLTIKEWNPRQRAFKLGFPNEEVKYGFLNALAPSYLKVQDAFMPFNIDTLDDAVEAGDTDGMCKWFTSLFAILPYTTSCPADSITEQNFQNVIYISFIVLGKYARTEVRSSKGRADCIVETSEYVYIFEFTRDKSAAEALSRIDEKGYSIHCSSDKRKIFKIGVHFSSSERNIVEWCVG